MRKFRGHENANKIFRTKPSPLGSLSLKSLAKSAQKNSTKEDKRKENVKIYSLIVYDRLNE